MIAVELDRAKLEEFCRANRIKSLALFGSVLREDFRPDSDIDVLVEFEPGSSATLFDLGRMQMDLTEMLGRKVDFVSRDGIEASRNPFRRKAILSTARTIVGAETR